MPDWTRRVDRRLGPLAIPPRRRDEIVRELAGVLEDRYEERLRLGESPRAARRAAMASAGGWWELAREIERVEGPMARRWRAVWLPGLAVSVAAQGLLLALIELGAGGGIVWHPPRPPVFLFWPWLLTLPLLGAAGAEWSRLQGGGRIGRLVVAVFPLTPWLVFFPVGAAKILSEDIPTSEKLLAILISGLLTWMIVPAMALLLGALPVLRRPDAAARPA